MEVIVGKLNLGDIQTGFTQYYKYIHDVKISILGEISKKYPNAHIKLYEIYSKYALIHETDNLLSTFFKDFEVVGGESPVNSSPINNTPQILVDGTPVALNSHGINLVETNHVEKLPEKNGKTILKINYPITREVFHKLKDKFLIIADIEDILPENLLEKQLTDNLNELDTLSQILLIKVLRGENICG